MEVSIRPASSRPVFFVDSADRSSSMSMPHASSTASSKSTHPYWHSPFSSRKSGSSTPCWSSSSTSKELAMHACVHECACDQCTLMIARNLDNARFR